MKLIVPLAIGKRKIFFTGNSYPGIFHRAVFRNDPAADNDRRAITSRGWAILALMEYPATINPDKMAEPIIMNFRFAFSITDYLTPIRLRRRRNCHKGTRTQSETVGLYLS